MACYAAIRRPRVNKLYEVLPRAVGHDEARFLGLAAGNNALVRPLR
jgi:hypothetical protein